VKTGERYGPLVKDLLYISIQRFITLGLDIFATPGIIIWKYVFQGFFLS